MALKWFLPEKFSKKWLKVLIAYSLVLFILLAGIWVSGINSQIDFQGMAGLFIFSFLLALIVCTFGFLKLKFVFSVTSLGIILGILFMAITIAGDINGWEDLAGVAYFIQFSGFGLVAGIIAELLAFFIRRHGNKAP